MTFSIGWQAIFQMSLQGSWLSQAADFTQRPGCAKSLAVRTPQDHNHHHQRTSSFLPPSLLDSCPQAIITQRVLRTSRSFLPFDHLPPSVPFFHHHSTASPSVRSAEYEIRTGKELIFGPHARGNKDTIRRSLERAATSGRKLLHLEGKSTLQLYH